MHQRRTPARQIPLSRRSHIIGFQPLASGSVAHESALERDFVTLTSFVYPSAVIMSQPITIRFREGSVYRRYTPDFLVHHPVTSLTELIEVKYEADLRERWTRLKCAFEAAHVWAQENHATFRTVTECGIRGATLNNAKRLLPLRDAPVDRKITVLVLTAARTMERPTLGKILARVPDKPAALATLWRLIARGTVRADLSRPIGFNTDIAVP